MILYLHIQLFVTKPFVVQILLSSQHDFFFIILFLFPGLVLIHSIHQSALQSSLYCIKEFIYNKVHLEDMLPKCICLTNLFILYSLRQSELQPWALVLTLTSLGVSLLCVVYSLGDPVKISTCILRVRVEGVHDMASGKEAGDKWCFTRTFLQYHRIYKDFTETACTLLGCEQAALNWKSNKRCHAVP